MTKLERATILDALQRAGNPLHHSEALTELQQWVEQRPDYPRVIIWQPHRWQSVGTRLRRRVVQWWERHIVGPVH